MHYVYMLRAGQNHYKIGIAKNLLNRVAGIQTSNPNKVEIVAAIIAYDAGQVERTIHQYLHTMRANGGTEWFSLTDKQAIDLCVYLQSFSDRSIRLELNEKIVLNEMIAQQKNWKKSLEKKLDLIINAYQKPRKVVANPASIESKTPKVVRPSDDEDVGRARIIFKSEGKASTSLLQRKMKIGYGRAARIVESMESRGLVSHPDGVKPRSLLY